MNYSSPDDLFLLEQQIRVLENQNRALRSQLQDEFTAAALTGLLAHGWGPDDLVAVRAVEIARLTLEARE